MTNGSNASPFYCQCSLWGFCRLFFQETQSTSFCFAQFLKKEQEWQSRDTILGNVQVREHEQRRQEIESEKQGWNEDDREKGLCACEIERRMEGWNESY